MPVQLAAWTSQSGVRVTFEVHRVFDRWLDVGGVYLMCTRWMDSSYRPLYIGETCSFESRLCSHEDWPVAAAHGATDVLAAVVQDSQQRASLELLLVSELQPPLNRLLREPLGILAGLTTALSAAAPTDLTRGVDSRALPVVLPWTTDAVMQVGGLLTRQLPPSRGLLAASTV